MMSGAEVCGRINREYPPLGSQSPTVFHGLIISSPLFGHTIGLYANKDDRRSDCL